VKELQERFGGFNPDALADNDAFLDAVVTATRIVDRTSHRRNWRCCATLFSTPSLRQLLTTTPSVSISP